MKLRQNTDGAILVMGLFMAVFLVAILYYLIGIGEAIYYRERMQDAADSAAFASASIHARGMNFIVLCNIIMAILVAIVLAVGLLENLLDKAAWFLLATSLFNPGNIALAGAARAEQQVVNKAYKVIEKTVNALLVAVHAAEVGISYMFPVAGTAKALAVARGPYRPPAQFVVAWPIFEKLPVETDSLSVLCDHAHEYLDDIVTLPLPGPLRGPVKVAFEILKGLISAGAKSYCDPSAPPAEQTTEEERVLPPFGPNSEKCASEDDISDDERNAACAEAETESKVVSDFDQKTGVCHTEACKVRRVKAATQCDPDTREKTYDHVWQERVVVRSMRRDARGRIEDEIVVEGDPYLHHQNGENDLPCRTPPWVLPPVPAALNQSGEYDLIDTVVAHGWKKPNSAYPTIDEQRPLCYQAYDEPLPRALKKEEYRVRYIEVTEIVGCKEKFTRRYKFSKKLAAAEEVGDSRSPLRVKKEAVLGEEDFQIRAFVIGDGKRDLPEKVVKIATWGQVKESESALPTGASALGVLQRGSVAQSEFFFDGDASCNVPENKSEWMWSMKWKARFRRFRMPSANATSETPRCASSEGDGNGCASQFENLGELLNGISAH